MITYPDPQAVVEASVDWLLAGWSPAAALPAGSVSIFWLGTRGENTPPPEAPASDSQSQTLPAAWLRYTVLMPSTWEGEFDLESYPTGQGALQLEISVQPGTGTEPWRTVWAQLLERFAEFLEATQGEASVQFLPHLPIIQPLGIVDGWMSRLYSVPFWIRGGPEDLPAQ